jgi:hypothetical protein
MKEIVWIAVLTALNWATVTQGAPIHWGPPTDVFRASEVVNSGTLIEAYNEGGPTSGSDQTVNGVLFTGTTSLLSSNSDSDVVDAYSGDTGDAAYNALLRSFDYGGGTDIVSLEVGGGNLTVGTEYMIQVWHVEPRSSKQAPVGDAESPPNTVERDRLPGQFATGTFVADGSTQTITLETLAAGLAHITAYQIRDRVTPEEMMANLDVQLNTFPDYSWDKVSRWGYGRKNNRFWKKAEIDIMGSRCKYIWLQESPVDTEKFKAAYPDNIYCFDSYVNLEKTYHNPDPFNPEFYLYNASGDLAGYRSGQRQYNHANPDVRAWWLNFISDCANESPGSDVIFIDSIQKALRVSRSDLYDYWGNPVSATYMEKAIAPLLESVRDELSEDFIIQGNFLRASGGYTDDANFSYVTNYTTSVYLEGFEAKGHVHKGIEYVQKAAAMGIMIAPNFGAPNTCENIEEARKKASQAMPSFWARLDATEQDSLASMYYSSFDYKLGIFLIMAGEHSYFRYQSAVVANGAGTDLFRIVPPFPEFDRRLGKPISDGVRISDTSWQREFEYCKVTLNVDAETADFDWRFQAVQVDFGATGGYGNGTTAEGGTIWNGIEPGANGAALMSGTTQNYNNLVDSTGARYEVDLALTWANDHVDLDLSQAWNLLDADRDGDCLGIRTDNAGVYHVITLSSLTAGESYDVTVWTVSETDFRVNDGTVQALTGTAQREGINGATSYTFEGVVATGGTIVIDWGDITSNYGADHWSTVTAISVQSTQGR